MNITELNRLKQHFNELNQDVEMHNWLNECGTSGCIAGWCCLLNGYKRADDNCRVITANGIVKFTQDAATDLLELNPNQSDNLFYPSNWPKEYNPQKYKDKNKWLIHSSIVAKRIQQFIDSNGEE